MKILTKYQKNYEWTQNNVAKLKESFEKAEKMLIGAYEVHIILFEDESEVDLADTLNRLIKNNK